MPSTLPGCKRCAELEQRTAAVVAELGLEASITKVTDDGEIAAHGVMRTPALVVDGTVVVAGRVPTAGRLRELLAGA